MSRVDWIYFWRFSLSQKRGMKFFLWKSKTRNMWKKCVEGFEVLVWIAWGGRLIFLWFLLMFTKISPICSIFKQGFLLLGKCRRDGGGVNRVVEDFCFPPQKKHNKWKEKRGMEKRAAVRIFFYLQGIFSISFFIIWFFPPLLFFVLERGQKKLMWLCYSFYLVWIFFSVWKEWFFFCVERPEENLFKNAKLLLIWVLYQKYGSVGPALHSHGKQIDWATCTAKGLTTAETTWWSPFSAEGFPSAATSRRGEEPGEAGRRLGT